MSAAENGITRNTMRYKDIPNNMLAIAPIWIKGK